MKKIYLMIALLIAGHCLLAQNVKFTLQGGINLPSISGNAPQSAGGSSRTMATFQFGGLLDINLKNVTLQPGVLLTGKGNFTTTTENFVSAGKDVPYQLAHNTNINYLEVPLNVLYKHEAKPGTWYFGAGPYVAYALGGSYGTKATMNTYYKKALSTGATFGSGPDDLKRTDFGANVLAGLQMKNGLKLGLNYGLGLTNITNTGGSAQNRVISLVVGYCF